MATAMAMPGNTAATFLTHLFGSGLADDRYVVERLRAMADGDIRIWPGDEPATTRKGRHKARGVTATQKAVNPFSAPSGRAQDKHRRQTMMSV